MTNTNKRLVANRTIRLALFILPIAYIAGILGVAIHEILGHGLTALLLGGEFNGFVLKWDAMGWAYCSLPSTAILSDNILHLLSGIIATTVVGGLLFGCATLSKRAGLQLALWVLGYVCLMDGIPYLFWNAYHPVLPGDIGIIISQISNRQNLPVELIRWIFMFFSAALFIGTTFLFWSRAFAGIEGLVLVNQQFTNNSRILALLFLVILPGTAFWFLFDWNQLAPGIGILPNIVGALSSMAMAGILFWYKPRLQPKVTTKVISWIQIALSWGCLIVTLASLSIWFAKGIIWR